MIKTLSYVVVTTPNLAQWCELAINLVGLHADVISEDQVVRLRMDEKVQRLLLQSTTGPSALTMGFEVDDAAALARVAQDLTGAGYSVVPGVEEEITKRGVTDMFHFIDADGSRVEVAYGLKDAASALRPGRPIGGFRTGELGMGHVALKAGNFPAMSALFKDVLHFSMSDFAREPFPVEFFHVNPRHHTVGLADTGTGAGIYHLMLEYNDWDDVGRALDMALEHPESIGVSLGRHSNDHITSFYVRTPDGWLLELGWGARLIDGAWQVEELPGLSLWGHERTWLPPEKREKARQQLNALAARGVRAPMAPLAQGSAPLSKKIR
ncbi:VOC family protein [Pararobbsia alpina]|uniref:Biphenyl-2,3-diol 1,2-dioxygenase n=1 Tax=Pararobbsia alpina TaxID=621374 RepID=A0A6S7CRR8_9BURK|nr:VOC family protein [Pararobbsia alpina]CAB3796265.1 Biphenyl-2,3-diol 1,2-dioxygenase [Pararobbsia alpina]